MRGLGDLMESASIARRHNAIAAEQEMKNALTWVHTYFEARALNKAYRAKENPSYMDRLKHEQEVMKEKITKLFQETMKGNVTRELNWLLRELSGPTMAYQYLPGEQALTESKLDTPLEPRDVSHIRLTDGGHSGGHSLSFSADNARVLETRWPRAMRGPELAEARTRFETTRDEVLKQIQTDGKVNSESEGKLTRAVDDLTSAFNDTYPPEQRLKSGADYSNYAVGKRFLQALADGVVRALETNDRWIFDGSYKFQGKSLVELLQHMSRNGLEFAPPEPGDEGTYNRLFLGLRNVYLNLIPDASAAAPEAK
jgi:hypothetical protein